MYALITGATSGIGEAFSYKLAREGYNLILTARNEAKLKALRRFLQKRYGIKVKIIQADLSQLKQVNQLINHLRKEKLVLELFVNNAGVGSYGTFDKALWQKEAEVIDLNIRAFTYLTKGILPLICKGGSILQVASTAAFAPGPHMAVYYASKAYVLSFSIALREELKKKGIKVNVLCPGPTNTHFQQHAQMKKAEFSQKFIMSPQKVAEIAYKGILKNKAIILPGLINQLAVFGMQYMPIELSAKCVALTQKSESE